MGCAPAAAQPPSKCAKPVDCFVEFSQAAFGLCQIAGQMGFGRPRKQAPNPDLTCIDQTVKTVEGMYAEAAAKTPPGPKTERLKDYYAAFRSAMNGIRSQFDESFISYRYRQQESTKLLDAKAERLILD